MIIVLKNNRQEKQVEDLVNRIKGLGFGVQFIEGSDKTVLCVIGDTSKVDTGIIKSLDVVESVKRISEPYKSSNRKFHHSDSIINVSGCFFGGDNFQIIAGPCSVESENQIITVAKAVKDSGATLLRGGAFKPRTSPYAFQGLKEKGIKLLLKAGKETGLPVVTELMSFKYFDLFNDVDLIQVGARNMQNFELLKELGRLRKPVLLKRGFANTLEELLMSAEYIMAEGNENVILCERGIRSFETYYRNTLDITAIPVLKERTHLPVIVDPSHAAGLSRLIPPLCLAAAAVGSDGLMVEVHNDPGHALSDGVQALSMETFDKVVGNIKTILPVNGKQLAHTN